MKCVINEGSVFRQLSLRVTAAFADCCFVRPVETRSGRRSQCAYLASPSLLPSSFSFNPPPFQVQTLIRSPNFASDIHVYKVRFENPTKPPLLGNFRKIWMRFCLRCLCFMFLYRLLFDIVIITFHISHNCVFSVPIWFWTLCYQLWISWLTHFFSFRLLHCDWIFKKCFSTYACATCRCDYS